MAFRIELVDERCFQSMLDECRMLILTCQVMLGAAAECAMESGFNRLSMVGRGGCAVQLIAATGALLVLMLPAAYHRVVAGGATEPGMVRLMKGCLAVGFAPMGAGLACAGLVVGERSGGGAAAWSIAAGIAVAALLGWYVFPVAARRFRAEEPQMDGDANKELAERIKHALTEARMVLPGAQALVSFSVVGVLAGRYESLDRVLKLVHALGFAAVSFAVVLLMTVPAYHRLADGGGMTERFHRVATRLLLGAMAAIAAALALDSWLVIEVVTERRSAGVAAACLVFSACVGVWFVWTSAVRTFSRPPATRNASSPA